MINNLENKKLIGRWRMFSKNKKLVYSNPHTLKMIDMLEQQSVRITELERELKKYKQREEQRRSLLTITRHG